ncbi:hypothetical protein [Dyella kyungheensis]|uniref:Uncharacterized protein n=1 Tax=Dyella kyungheensis TaxID=1242174 RepID=A0ABS2JLQ4_9GAMM|nr:hypothetical protein [Dyella kyungheensis]MBM7119970.1 hypothetical protein [Dyella kyungheensis]
MATRDHTVRIRSSVPPDDTLTPPLGGPSSTAAAWPETLRHGTRSARGDIALAVLALTRLRIDSGQCRVAQARGFPGRPLPWPLPAAVTASLGTAIHCLQQYARLLGDEPRVTTTRLR